MLLLQVQVSEIILTMALLEIDSFVLKFKNLLHLEKDASLTKKSEAGRAVVTLSVELGHVLSAPLHFKRKPRIVLLNREDERKELLLDSLRKTLAMKLLSRCRMNP